jgi:hypothetical protein
MIHLVGLINGTDEIVSAVLGIAAAGIAALGPKLVDLVGAWLEKLKPDTKDVPSVPPSPPPL